MSISTSISRITVYLRRNGFRATVGRAALAVNRMLFARRMVIFYCDLSGLVSWPADLPSSVKMERKRTEAEVSEQDLQEVISFWDPKLARQNIEERFSKGASLWLIRSEGNLAGFGWTVRGCTMEPYFLPLGKDDPYLFDGFVFPQYRGRSLMPLWLNHALQVMAAECNGRAFTEVAEWNQAILASLKKTPFRRLGSAAKLTILHHTIVWWEQANPSQEPKGELKKVSI